MTLKIYDVNEDEMVDATQERLNSISAAAECGFLLRRIISRLEPKTFGGIVDWNGARKKLRETNEYLNKYSLDK